MRIGSIANVPMDNKIYMQDDRFVLPRCNIGIEIEAEKVGGVSIQRVFNTGLWDFHDDGSLRNNGQEFVFCSPMFGKDAHNAIESIIQIGREENWFMSDRTSIHVHLDVRDLEMRQLFNLITLYLIFERCLYQYSSNNERVNNIFCLPYYSSDFHVYRLHMLSQNVEDMNTAQQRMFTTLQQFSKYSGLNISAITQRGSLEFRQMKGNLDYNYIMNWINIIQSLKKYAINMDWEPEDIPVKMSSMSTEGFLCDVFGEYAECFNYPSVSDDILKGVRLAQDAVYGHRYSKVVAMHKPTVRTGCQDRFRQFVINNVCKIDITGVPFNEEEANRKLNGAVEDNEEGDAIQNFLNAFEVEPHDDVDDIDEEDDEDPDFT